MWLHLVKLFWPQDPGVADVAKVFQDAWYGKDDEAFNSLIGPIL